MGWIENIAEVSDCVVRDGVAFQTLSREWGSVYKLRVRTRVREARALSRNLALTYSSDSSKVWQTAGTYYFEYYTRKVERSRANAADGWTVLTTETWSALYRNNTWQAGCDATCFTSANPSEPGDPE